MDTLKKLLDLLSPPEIRQAALISLTIIFMAILEALGVASIMPFMAVVANPEIIESNIILRDLYTEFLEFKLGDKADFTIALGGLVFVFLIISLSIKALTTYLQLKFSLMREYTISKKLVEGYLRQPYAWFLSQNSSDLNKTILSEVPIIINSGILPTLVIFAHSCVVLALLTMLVVINPVVSVSVGLVLASAYGSIFILMRGFLSKIGSERVKANKHRFSAVNEAFGAIKELKAGRLESRYIKKFAEPAFDFARHTASAQLVAQLPRFFLEALAFGGMLVLVLVLLLKNGDLLGSLPTIALYGYAGYRIMPALQQIYYSFSHLKFVAPALTNVHEHFFSMSVTTDLAKSTKGVVFENSIRLDNVLFRYDGQKSAALDKVNIMIPAGKKVGFVGPTGSGKTTIVDMILGLVEPQSGKLVVDGEELSQKNISNWMGLIGYVPQNVYLSDDTIANNIAFGVDDKEIDQDALYSAAETANIHSFISNDLESGYATVVGERGVRISGGQRQRIGIARALYHQPKILVFDEATSALDAVTEREVMNAIDNLGRDITVIIVAHRLNTVRNCDHLYMLENGKIVCEGKFSKLIKENKKFRSMVKFKPAK